ncbi:TPA: hypothetical protein ACH3X3_003846 [Trebouxia sp. C0006]
MGAALSHSLHHSRCPSLLTLERKHLLVNTRPLLLIAAFRPGCSAFRRPAQVQQCARLMSICGQQPQELSKYMLASMHASPYYQHPFCTEIASGISSSNDSSNDSICKHQLQKEQHEEVEPNVSLLADDLQKQWLEKLNVHLGSILIRPASHRKVWWSCDQCPDRFSHVWEARVDSRTYGRGCPFCSGTAVCQHNTLARKAPEVALFWDAKKNHPLSTDQVTVSSNMRAHWKCKICLHEWRATVTVKARTKSGCPKCAMSNGNRRADGTRQKQPTFAIAKHALLDQWDHDRNSENENFPANTKLGSHKLIWWRCHECPKGKVHSWQARPCHRTSHKSPRGCPSCDGKKLCACNSLETVCPDIAADFDIENNGVTAAEVTSSATAKYCWLSDKPGAKKRSVTQRTWDFSYAKLGFVSQTQRARSQLQFFGKG